MNSDHLDINKDKPIKFRLGTFIALLWAIIFATFTLTTIYNRFLGVDARLSVVAARVEYVNDRLTRTNESLEEEIKDHHHDHLIGTE